MHVEIRIHAGRTPERTRLVLLTADDFVVGTVLDALRMRLGYMLPDDEDAEPRPPAHQPRQPAATG